jgi:hypothetical protein
MRTALVALVAAAGIGLCGAATTVAAPASGSAILGQAQPESLVQQVRHCRYSHWRRWCHHHHHYWRWSRRY